MGLCARCRLTEPFLHCCLQELQERTALLQQEALAGEQAVLEGQHRYVSDGCACVDHAQLTSGVSLACTEWRISLWRRTGLSKKRLDLGTVSPRIGVPANRVAAALGMFG